MIFLRHKRLRNSSRGVVAILALAMVVLIHTAHYGSSDAFIAARLPLRTSTSAAALERRVGSLSHTPLPPRIPLTALSDGLSAVSQRFQHQRRRSQDREGRNGFYTRVVVRISSAISSKPSPDDDDIDLTTAMANARANLAAGRSPGAGLDSAFDQADAAFADLIVTSVDDQDITLDDEVRPCDWGWRPCIENHCFSRCLYSSLHRSVGPVCATLHAASPLSALHRFWCIRIRCAALVS